MTGTRRRWPLAALAIVAVIGAGCGSDAASKTGAGNTASSTHEKAMKFAACMRDNGVSGFPDPDASGATTVDRIVNGSSLDPSSPAWKRAIDACRDLEPPGFTGRKRSAHEQKIALEFAQCMRDHGVEDFPDPTPDGPLIDTTRIPSAAGRGALSIPGFKAATDRCSAVFSGELVLRGR